MRDVIQKGLAAAIVIAALPALGQNPAGGIWEALAPMPDRRTEVSVSTDGERLFVLGGFALGNDGNVYAPLEVWAFAPASDTWTVLTELPAGVNHAGLAFLDGALYVVGGFRGTSFNATDRLMIYESSSATWREGPPLPTARGALAVVVQDGRIHAIGGEGATGARTAHEIFDPETNTWNVAPDMPTGREHLAAAVVGDEIVVLGGRNGRTTIMTTNEIYDIAAETWRTGADVPTGRSGIAAVALDGFVYLFGGEQFDRGRSTFAEAERYDPAADLWARMPDMPTARHGIGAAVIDGRIYVPSGGPAAGFAFSNILERFTPAR